MDNRQEMANIKARLFEIEEEKKILYFSLGKAEGYNIGYTKAQDMIDAKIKEAVDRALTAQKETAKPAQ